jgi:shikimate dehydrogenase
MRPEANAAIAGDTRLFAIVGDPIAQARSPAVFNHLFAERGVNAVLVPMQVPPQHLESAIAGLKAIANLDGIVVTVPHKVALVKAVDELGPLARRVGAINCMRRMHHGGWEGEMYDGAGFIAGLRRQGHEPAAWRVFQAGCGGAGRAVAHALASAEVSALDLADVDTTRRHALASELRSLYPGVEIREANSPDATHDLVVNATPCGMAADDALPFDIALIRPHAVVADLIMKPERTKLLEAAASRGCGIHLGRHLLESQALLVAGFFGLTEPLRAPDHTVAIHR